MPPPSSPRLGVRGHLVALAGFVCLAVAYSWPLPLHLRDGLPGPVSGDTGVYLWNLWVFRHAIVSHGATPFFTAEVFSLSPALPLALQNYTTLADVVAFPLLPRLGLVATFNVLLIGSGVASAYAMFLCARRLTGDTAAGWVAGLVFGFCPFMSARGMEHFSLVQAAPLPLFVMCFERLQFRPTTAAAAGTGVVLACAFLCDPYYAVYCLLMALFSIGNSAVLIRHSDPACRPRFRLLALDIALVCLAGLIAGMAISGGGQFEIFSLRIGLTRLYTPVLIFTVLVVVRAWLAVRHRVAWVWPSAIPAGRTLAAAALGAVVMLTPVLSALLGASAEREWARPTVFWRSSPPGLDLFALFVPNPLHPWFGRYFAEGARLMPGGFVENIASIPWTLTLVLLLASTGAARALPRYWVVFTVAAASLALGPFVRIGGVMTYVPTPWALLRYLPVIGAARMPQRMAAVMMLGLALLLAFALRAIRERLAARSPGRRWRLDAVTALVAAGLVWEMLPAPRVLYSPEVPAVNRLIAADPRPIRVLNLPFGLRDGMSSHGNASASAQYFQTVHEKQLLGGYVSRLPRRSVSRYRRLRVTRVLMALSEGREVPAWRAEAAIEQARAQAAVLNVGYVVVDTRVTSAELLAFTSAAFDLTFVASDGAYALYRTPLASPPP